MFGINIKTLRWALGWNFAFMALICAAMSILVILRTMRFKQEAFQHAASSNPLVFFLYAVFPVAAVLFGVAWWKIWRQRPSARTWGIAACILLALHPLWRVIGRQGSVHIYNFIVLAVAIVGLIAFSIRDNDPLGENDHFLEDPPYEGT